MKKLCCLLLLAFASLSLPAYSAPTPKTVIPSFPYIIRNPGTYVLNADMSVPAGVNVAIEISSVATGPITVDLNGHTITGTGTNTSVGITVGGINGPGEIANTYPITIKDGTLSGFVFGVFVDIATGNGSNAWASDVTVSHLVFNTDSVQDGAGVYFREVNNSVIKGCTFNGGTYGIEDSQSQGGNSYLNCTFTGAQYPILTQQGLAGGSLTTTVGHYESVATPAN